MRKDKVVHDFRRICVPNKITFGRSVIAKMTLIDLFAKPDVDYAIATSTVDKLEAYYISSRNGSHQQMALMHQTKKKYDEVFRELGQYVDRKADGNAAIILSSGFNLVKQPKPRVKTELCILRSKVSGAIKLRRIAVAKATAYVWQYSIGGEVPMEISWILGGCSAQATFIIEGLTPGTKVWFRVAAVTREGMQAFTNPIMKVVQ
ncbi:MAG TPA: fibronectin type III domain-containing protein [Paludibacter sp.]